MEDVRVNWNGGARPTDAPRSGESPAGGDLSAAHVFDDVDDTEDIEDDADDAGDDDQGDKGDKPEGDKKPEGEEDKADSPDDVEALKQRIAELEGKTKETEGFQSIIEALKKSGVTDTDALQKVIADNQAKADFDTKVAKLYDEYAAKVDADEMTPEQAEREYLAKVEALRANTELDRLKTDLVQRQEAVLIAEVAAEYPTLKSPAAQEIVKTLHRTTGADLKEVAKYLHTEIDNQTKAAVTAYAAEQAKQQGKPTPMRGSEGGGDGPDAEQYDEDTPLEFLIPSLRPLVRGRR